MSFIKENKFKITAVTVFSLCMAALLRIYFIMDVWMAAFLGGCGLM